jgi:putative flippase GtrA
MIGAFGAITAGVAIFFWEGRFLFKQKRKKEMAVFSISLFLAVILYIGVALHLPIPSPTEVIGKWLEPIVRPIVLWIKGGSS